MSEDLRRFFEEAGAVREIEERLRRAEEICRMISVDVIGRVSPFEPAKAEEGKNRCAVIVSVDKVYTYGRARSMGLGDYLVSVNPLTGDIVLLRVVTVERADMRVNSTRNPSDIPQRNPRTLGVPARLEVEVISAWVDYRVSGSRVDVNSGAIKPATYPLEPQAPVGVPRPEIFGRLLGLPTEGVLLGCYVTSSLKPVPGLPVYFPVEGFFTHMLIAGTTGSGKTITLKNMIACLLNRVRYSGRVPTVIAFDTTYEFLQMVFPKPRWVQTPNVSLEEELTIYNSLYTGVQPLSEIVLLLPVTKAEMKKLREEVVRGLKGEVPPPEELVRKIGERMARKFIIEDFMRLADLFSVRLEVGKRISVDVDVIEGEPVVREIHIPLTLTQSGVPRSVTVHLIPFCLKFSKIRDRVRFLSQLFTMRAQDQFPHLLEYVESELGERPETLRDLIDILTDNIREISGSGVVHRETLFNILRTLKSLENTGVFDVPNLTEPDFPSIVMKYEGRLIDVCVRGGAQPVVYRILDTLLEWKMTSYRGYMVGPPLIAVLDEAHVFFPKKKTPVEEILEKLTRLARKSAFGFVFATQYPKDVSDIIYEIVLSNTRICLRLTEKALETAGVPSPYDRIVANAPDRVAVVVSNQYQGEGVVLFKTTLPIVGHYDQILERR